MHCTRRRPCTPEGALGPAAPAGAVGFSGGSRAPTLVGAVLCLLWASGQQMDADLRRLGPGFVRLGAGCGHVRPAGARGFASCRRVPRRTRPRPACGARAARASACTFLRFVVEADAPETLHLWPPRAKPQVRRTMMKRLIAWMASETPRTTPKGAEPAHNRATNRKNVHEIAFRRRVLCAPPTPCGCPSLAGALGLCAGVPAPPAGALHPPPPAGCGRRRSAAHFLRFVAGVSAREEFVHIF